MAATAPPLSLPQLVRRQQRLEHLAGCALRAQAGRSDLSIQDSRAWQGTHAIGPLAPHLQLHSLQGLEQHRAVADAIACRLLHGDPDVFEAHAPQDDAARRLYDWFEQLRCESLAQDTTGAQHNLAHHFRQWTLRFHQSPLVETQLGQLLFALCQLIWSRLNGLSPPEEVIDTMEVTRARLAPLWSADVLEMARSRTEPARFAVASARLAQQVAALMEAERAQASRYPADRKRAGAGQFSLWLDAASDASEALPVALTGDSRSFEPGGVGYTVFTREFDREMRPTGLVRPALLAQYRARLDDLLREQPVPTHRLARLLAATVTEPERRDWESELESGRIDGRRLSRVLTSATDRRIFRRDSQQPQVDCAITLLIDCSGSMKTHAEQLALYAQVWSRMARLAQVPMEILGFSTASWHGGRAARAWSRAGRRPHAGRVAERLHWVFQAEGDRWHDVRMALACLLKLDFYREGLDGEAVQWAGERLQQHEAARRVLLVVSDGCPMEMATQQANDEFYLDNHLKLMVRQQQAQGIEVIGVGLGLDLSPFYPRQVALDPAKLLHTESFAAVLEQLRRR